MEQLFSQRCRSFQAGNDKREEAPLAMMAMQGGIAVDWYANINHVLDYIETQLDGQISHAHIAKLAACSIDHFNRLFSYIAGQPIGEYIRLRRLTMAANDLRRGQRILDVALRYGYESHDAFTRAFQRFHGITPSAARSTDAPLNACHRFSLRDSIQGGMDMQHQIESWPSFTLAGYPTWVPEDQAFATVPKIWEQAEKDGTMERLIQLWKQADSRPSGILGSIHLGERNEKNEFLYLLGVTLQVDGFGSAPMELPEGLHIHKVPASLWAIFPASGGLSDSVQNVHKAFYSQWLPGSEYGLADMPVLECYFPDRQEVWFGISKQEA